MSASSSAQSGRDAAIARRQALSAGKAALPQATDRMRGAALPRAAAASDTALPTPAPAVTSAAPPAAATAVSAVGSLAGRLLSMLRRRQMSAGKQSLPAVAAVAAVSPSATVMRPAATPSSAAPSPASAAPDMAKSASSGPEQARARRAELSRYGRGNAAPTQPSRPVRQEPPASAIQVNQSPASGGGQVTGSRIGRGRQVTGHEPGATLPISGTQHIGANGDAAACAGGPKVGLARTAGGLLVSGTLVRSKVQVTGDEAGNSVTITGEADQRPGDDLTPRADGGVYGAGQFQRQTNPHGHTAFGINLARSAQSVGSRERLLQPALEATDGGMSITGSALGRARTLHVTGDEDGASRHVTGDQYLTQARRQAERSGGSGGGGSAPRQQMCAARRERASGAQPGIAQTPSEHQVSGVDVDPNPRVTGDESGSCVLNITGTPYHGGGTAHAFGDPVQRQPAGAPQRGSGSHIVVSGDTPPHYSHHSHVTGTARGAARAISGTPYCPGTSERSERSAQPPMSADPVALVDKRFSVASPQRAAHLRADPKAVQAATAAGRITGSFAVGQDKITGNIEFVFRPRRASDADAKRATISGEGRTEGRTITGGAWSEQKNVTGTEGYIAAERNPSQRAGKPHAFAGAGRFKALATHEEPKQLVSGMVGGGMSQSAAKVTLSGGAQA